MANTHGVLLDLLLLCGVLHMALATPIDIGYTQHYDRMIDADTADFKNWTTQVKNSAECCSECEALDKTYTVFVFAIDRSFCGCYAPKKGVQVATKVPNQNDRKWVKRPLAGICGTPANAGAVTEPEALELKVNNVESSAPKNEGVKVCSGTAKDIKCCSEGFTTGDNAGDGGERFVQQDEYKEGGCAVTCQKLDDKSTGISESLTQNYPGTDKKKCWCEFGVAVLKAHAGYQTCVFE